MQSDSLWTGHHFLKETLFHDDQKKPETEPKTKICGVCEPNQSIITLPAPSEIAVDPVILWDALDGRKTIRVYSHEDIQRWELSLLLHYTQGSREEKNGTYSRTVPSAGALHPFETRMVINRVDGIEPGIYRYLPLDHALVREECHSGDHQSVAKSCQKSFPGFYFSSVFYLDCSPGAYDLEIWITWVEISFY